jgi:hypothetical protein
VVRRRFSEGNGEPKQEVKINLVEMGPGWIALEAGDPPPEPERVAHLLCVTLNTWLKQHPQTRVRATLPVIHRGEMVAVHVWFDET